MNIYAFNGSPHASDSNTQIMVNELLTGAKKAGAKTKTIFLAKANLNACTGCMSCIIKTPGKCIYKDDMNKLIDLFLDADIAIFATPLHFANVTSIMKAFIDRFVLMLDPHFVIGPDGHYRHPAKSDNLPKMAVVANGNFPDEKFETLRIVFSKLSAALNTELIAEIYRNTGGLLRSKELNFQPMVENYKSLLRQAGETLAANGSIPQEIQEQMALPIIQTNDYVEYANTKWDWILSEQI